MPSGRQEEFWKQKHSNEIGWHASMLYGQKYVDTQTLYPATLFRLLNCLIMQISNQPITWQQLNAFRDVDMVR